MFFRGKLIKYSCPNLGKLRKMRKLRIGDRMIRRKVERNVERKNNDE